jgi:hypothetical protein
MTTITDAKTCRNWAFGMLTETINPFKSKTRKIDPSQKICPQNWDTLTFLWNHTIQREEDGAASLVT